MNGKECKECCGFRWFALAMALGITSGLWMLALAWGAHWFSWGNHIVEVMSSMYRGYHASVMGGVFGFLWGFIEGFLFGAVLSFFYNKCVNCKICKRS